MRRRLASLLFAALVSSALAACSPEASRQRGGGPGADIGNHSVDLPQPSTAPNWRQG